MSPLQRLPTDKHPTSAERYPILWQAYEDLFEFSKAQAVPAFVMAIGAFITAVIYGQVTSIWSGALFIVYSVLAGLLFYGLIAIVRAPFILISRQNRQLHDLSARIADVETRPATTTNQPLLIPADAAESNLVLRIDTGSIEVHTGADGIIEGHSVFDLRAIVIRCKNERESQPSRRVGSVGNVSGEITFIGYGEKTFRLPGELCVWLSDPNERVNFPAGVTQRLVVATFEKEKLCVVQRRSARRGPQVCTTELTSDLGNLFRVRIALYTDSERKPLVQGDYMLERDGQLFMGDARSAGPQLVSTSVWRRGQAMRFRRRAFEFWNLDSHGTPYVEFENDYANWEKEAGEFIGRHHGEPEKSLFLFEVDKNRRHSALGFALTPPPSTFRDRIDLQMNQLDRLENATGA